MTVKQSRLLAWSNVLAFALMVTVNGLAAGTTLIGGKDTSEISDMYPTLITPAAYALGIWGVIYVLLGAFVIYQALPRQRGKAFHGQIGWLFVLGSLLNICWLFAWQYEYLSLSVVLMFLLLVSLILIYTRLDIGRAKVERDDWLAVHLGFSVYLGWITIATIANVSVTLVSLDWDGFGIAPETWAILMLSIALMITVLVAATRRDLAYGLVVIWAFVAIAVNQGSTEVILAIAWAGVAVILIALTGSILYARRPSRVQGSG